MTLAETALTAAQTESVKAESVKTESALLGIAGDYLDSLTASDPAGAPFAETVRHTENGVDTPLTQGLWTTARGWLYRHTFVDAVTGQIGAFGSVAESGGAEAMVAFRLKTQGARITESELLIARSGDFALFEPRWRLEPKPEFKALAPADRRTPRGELATIPRRYFEAIMTGDPGKAPIHPDCNRFENGVQTTNNARIRSPSAAEGLRRLVYMQQIRDLRVPVIDEARGLVLGIVAFDMPVMETTITVRGRPWDIVPARHHLPRTLFLSELFKVEDGRITHIEAVLRNYPIGADMGWGSD